MTSASSVPRTHEHQWIWNGRYYYCSCGATRTALSWPKESNGR